MAVLKNFDTRWGGILRRAVVRGWFVLALSGLLPAGAGAQPPGSNEYKVKAAYLYNFAQFVEWPATAFRTDRSPLVIAVLGDDPFGAYLDEFVKDEKVEAHPLVVRRFHRGEEIGDCHILFISRSEAPVLTKSLALLQGRAVLTVGDTDTFTQLGGMVRFFVTEDGKVRFKINDQAAKAAALTISSKIRSPETIAPPGKD